MRDRTAPMAKARPSSFYGLDELPPTQCPGCHEYKVRRLWSMRKWDGKRDWFICDGCEHLVATEPREAAPPAPRYDQHPSKVA